MKILIPFFVLFITVFSAPNSDFEVFKTKALNKESIKTFIDELIENVEKEVVLRKQIKESIKSNEYVASDTSLTELFSTSKEILTSSIDWIEERESFVKDSDSKENLMEAKHFLEKELISMENVVFLVNGLDKESINAIKRNLVSFLNIPYIQNAIDSLQSIENYSSDDEVVDITDYNSDEFKANIENNYVRKDKNV